MTPAEWRMKLVEALRSGKYKQAHEKLRNGDAFCCLGVACAISGLGTWGHDYFTVNPEHRHGEQDKYPQEVAMPHAVRNLFGFETSEGQLVTSINDYQHLSTLNDNGYTFAQIADIIEQGKVATTDKDPTP